MGNIEQLGALAERHGWQRWDTSESGRMSWAYGIEEVACLFVRFGHHERVVHAIYVHFPTGNRDQYLYQRTRGKLAIVRQVLSTAPAVMPRCGDPRWVSD